MRLARADRARNTSIATAALLSAERFGCRPPQRQEPQRSNTPAGAAGAAPASVAGCADVALGLVLDSAVCSLRFEPNRFAKNPFMPPESAADATCTCAGL